MFQQIFVCSDLGNFVQLNFVQQLLFSKVCSTNFCSAHVVQQILFSKFCSANFVQQIWATIQQHSTICYQLIKLNSASVNQKSQLTHSANIRQISQASATCSATCQQLEELICSWHSAFCQHCFSNVQLIIQLLFRNIP